MKSIYLSLAASTLKKLRSMETDATLKEESVTQPDKLTKQSSSREAVVFKTNGLRVAHGSNGLTKTLNNVKSQQILPKRRATTETNKAKQQGLFTILQREECSNLSGEEVYEKMCNYIMTEEQLEENGYPRPGDIPGNCIFMVEKPKLNKDPTKKICSRCGKEFVLYKGGHFAKQDDECIYHWGRAYITKVGSTREKRYNCCQNTVGSEGCSVGETHVHQDNKLDTSGYVQTLDKSSESKTPGIFSLDCEMVHSTVGLELVRVSVVNYDCNVVYDTFVMPEGKVLDYNTRWSGVTDKDLVGVTTTLRDVQAQFLSKFSSDTILIGHSLESDLTALRIIHSSVVDTSVVFPHRLGPPFKRALRNLMSEFLGVLIQNADDEGHDSSEDATACIKLMKWKIEEDMKIMK
uniref:Putative exonuclease GOR-like protein n=1 Tax=Phallusia mammillata TaxID=59560 RepID=A0A6F9DR65_9ASCI|nr:putative exonuclease GOR-like protein [Phallusia mammillata]